MKGLEVEDLHERQPARVGEHERVQRPGGKNFRRGRDAAQGEKPLNGNGTLNVAAG
jgi:hypothetical protein